jgi:hypothetical protein
MVMVKSEKVKVLTLERNVVMMTTIMMMTMTTTMMMTMTMMIMTMMMMTATTSEELFYSWFPLFPALYSSTLPEIDVGAAQHGSCCAYQPL